jgi:hypothetical protein
VLESLEIKKCSMFPRCDLGKYEDVDGAADVEMLKDPCVLENDVWCNLYTGVNGGMRTKSIGPCQPTGVVAAVP